MTSNQWIAVGVVGLAAAAVGVYYLGDFDYTPCADMKCPVIVKATVTPASGSTPAKCNVDAVSPYKLKVKLKDARIIWKFDQATPNFQFCKGSTVGSVGDGAVLKSPDPYTQFYDRCRGNAEDCDLLNQPDCAQRYEMKTKKSYPGPYEYEIVFRDLNDKAIECKIDPFIKNG